MSLSNDSDPFDTLSIAETDASSDFELVDVENDEVRSFAPSSIGSDAASTNSDAESSPPSPQLHASRFHFPDPVSVFHDEELNLESSSLYTLLATSQQEPQQPPDRALPVMSPKEASHQTAAPVLDLGVMEKMDFTLHQHNDDKQAGPSQPHRRLITMAPKATWFVALFAAVLLGFKSSTLLGFTPGASPSHAVSMAGTNWNAKFASPTQIPSVSPIASQLVESSARTGHPVALPPGPSASGLTTKQCKKFTRKPDLPRASPRRSSSTSVALQKTASTSKSLSVVNQRSTDPSKVQRPVRASDARAKEAKSQRYAAFAGQMAFNVHSDLPVFPFVSRSSFLDNATTTSWAFWLAELDAYYQHSVRPTILAAKQQAYEAARLAQRYHQEQVLPAFACFRQHAIHTAQRTADFTIQYNQEQLRPAVTFVRKQAAQTAKRTASYHEQVLFPALAHFRDRAADATKAGSDGFSEAAKRFSSTAQRTSQLTSQYNERAFSFVREQTRQTARRTADYRDNVLVSAVAEFRLQAVEAAKTTSEGFNKAAKRFSSEAAETVQQVKKVTHINLEALGMDEYIGFMMATFKSMGQSERSSEKVA
ncbi:hypothetical protein EX895_002647 [Sporisorium graminicola]|uniref:Uncharacterized protein n=1 Tax=Sporisorium graminicola TaxID=280036 RepID=A0A4U7KUI0_9BASI|nr:hypothetical protein EX895_002647 [Sporisorium graminicola]TKY88295.1 hypothetical protein EX895_002647 [Sporisorium graminicola]